jgi:hypothetical protein
MKVCSTKRNVAETARLDKQHCCLTKIFRENLDKKTLQCVRRAQIPGVRPPGRLNFVGGA